MSSNKPVRRLLLLNQMAGSLFRELAEGLAQAMPEGCILYTGEPNTLKRAETRPLEGLTIKKAPIYDRRSTLKRLISWLSYVAGAVREIWRLPEDAAIVVVSNPPIMSPVVWLIGLLRRRPYIVLVYDIYPDIAVRMGYLSENHVIARAWRWLHRRVYDRAAAVVTIAHHMATHVGRQFSAANSPAGRVGVLFPWADADSIRPIARQDNPLAKRFDAGDRTVVLYSGNMGVSHDIASMMRAAKILEHRDDILFLFIGGGAKWQEAKDFQAQHQLSNMQVHAYVPEEELPYSMGLGDLCLVALDPGAEGMMIPSKIFYYMASGAAIVGIGTGENDLKEVIERAECGVCVGHGEPENLAAAIQSLADDDTRRQAFQKRARQAAENEYTPKAGVQTFLALMHEAGLIDAPSSPSPALKEDRQEKTLRGSSRSTLTPA